MARLTHRPQVKLRTSISTQLKNSLEILSLNTLELTQNLQKMMLENIFLEETRPAEVTLDEVMLQNSTTDKNQENTFETFAYKEKSLQEYLIEQVNLSDLNLRNKELANIIITSINKDGFINEDHDVIALNNGFSKKESSLVLSFLMSIDPSGVCAKDVWQSLEWQAKIKYPGDIVLLDLIAIFQQGKKEISELDKKTLQGLTEYLNISGEKIEQAIKKLQSLEMNPAGRFKVAEQNFIFPEILFSVKNDNIQINFTNPLLPDITLNSELLGNLQNDKNKKMWKNMYNEAKNLLKSVEYRKNSMIKIAKIIAAKQKLYFKKGEKYLKPMKLKDVAEVAHLNISTVSRIMKNKYCVTPFGVVPLAFFLIKSVKSSEDESLSVEDLKKSMKYIIEQENHSKPLSDFLIMEKLQEFGFNIKRRTVTKYRKLLHIPSAKQRTV